MLYRHEKTGAVIDVKSEMGGCWIPVKESCEPPEAAPKDRPSAAKTPKTAKK